jgi:hypothetical protein
VRDSSLPRNGSVAAQRRVEGAAVPWDRVRATEVPKDKPVETASFLVDGLHGLLLRSLHANRRRRAFVAAAWSLRRSLLGITG